MRQSVRVLALTEWLMVLPATVFLAAAALRLLQPRQFEPARMSWMIFDWTVSHVSSDAAAVLFAGMPGLVFVTGCVVLFRLWSHDSGLRQDAVAGFGILRRHLTVALLVTATLLGGAILVFAIGHAVTD